MKLLDILQSSLKPLLRLERQQKEARSVQRNRPHGENIVPPGGGDFDGPFHMLLPFDFREVQLLFSMSAFAHTLVERTGSKEISPRKKCTTSESERAP